MLSAANRRATHQSATAFSRRLGYASREYWFRREIRRQKRREGLSTRDDARREWRFRERERRFFPCFSVAKESVFCLSWRPNRRDPCGDSGNHRHDLKREKLVSLIGNQNFVRDAAIYLFLSSCSPLWNYASWFRTRLTARCEIHSRGEKIWETSFSPCFLLENSSFPRPRLKAVSFSYFGKCEPFKAVS